MIGSSGHTTGRRAMLAVVFALLLASLVALGQTAPVAADAAVAIQNFAFMPTPLTIPVGTAVMWTNRDSATHTTTSDAGLWDSGMLPTGKSFSFTFAQAGTFTYHCAIHPNMHGTIVVTPSPASQPTAAPSSQPGVGPPPASGGFADGAFQQLWAKTDANPGGHTYVWGPAPFTQGLMETYKEAPNGMRLVQYFDKARMELNAPGGPVTAGLLTVELITGRQQNGDATFVQRDPAHVTVAGDPDNAFPTYADLAAVQAAEADNSGGGAPVARMFNPDRSFGSYAAAMNDPQAKTAGYDAQTKHNLPKAFADFRNAPQFGGLPAIGLAVTEPVWANVKVAGKVVPVLVQGFERRVLTYTPSNPAGFAVEYGNIGRAYQQWRYQSGASAGMPGTPGMAAGASMGAMPSPATAPIPPAPPMMEPQPAYGNGYSYP
jgi:plastocyanin